MTGSSTDSREPGRKSPIGGARAGLVTVALLVGVLLAIVLPSRLIPGQSSEPAAPLDSRYFDPLPDGPVECGAATNCVTRASSQSSSVALTFDDCNDRVAWESISTTLAQQGVEATFFCTAKSILSDPTLVQQSADAGHEFGFHGFEHTHVVGLTAEQLSNRFDADEEAWASISAKSGVTPLPYFRPPFGKLDARAIATAKRRGLSIVLWDVDSEDWKGRRAPGIRRLAGRAAPGSIVLLHTTQATATALPSILADLRSRGLEPTRLSAML